MHIPIRMISAKVPIIEWEAEKVAGEDILVASGTSLYISFGDVFRRGDRDMDGKKNCRGRIHTLNILPGKTL
jgi:hypothetical protein